MMMNQWFPLFQSMWWIVNEFDKTPNKYQQNWEEKITSRSAQSQRHLDESILYMTLQEVFEIVMHQLLNFGAFYYRCHVSKVCLYIEWNLTWTQEHNIVNYKLVSLKNSNHRITNKFFKILHHIQITGISKQIH